ncbi:MAG TPA: hypothetical protein VNF74_03400 [Terriglobales bacterium]|nr:hypothetical protein [Terriglobales bacterium]
MEAVADRARRSAGLPPLVREPWRLGRPKGGRDKTPRRLPAPGVAVAPPAGTAPPSPAPSPPPPRLGRPAGATPSTTTPRPRKAAGTHLAPTDQLTLDALCKLLARRKRRVVRAPEAVRFALAYALRGALPSSG